MNMIYNIFSSLERKNRFDPKLWEVKRTFSSEKVHFISPTSYSDAALMLLSEDTKRVLFVLLLDILYTMHPAKQQSIGRAVGPCGEHNIMPLQSVSKWLFFVTLK